MKPCNMWCFVLCQDDPNQLHQAKWLRLFFKELILSSFTLPHVIPNMYDFLSSVEHNKIYFLNVLFLYIQSEEG